MPDDQNSGSLAELFGVLEQTSVDDIALRGVRQQRIRSASTCDLFISVRKPSLLRELTARFHYYTLPENYVLPEFRSLELHQEQEIENGITRLRITLRASEIAFNDIFTSLAEDLANSAGKPTEESEAALAFQRRLYQWQRLLQKTGVAGLTEEQQQGLYGELWCLREVVLPKLPASAALIAWSGPDGTDHDFQLPARTALEVKTTRSSSTQMLLISSERQLDDTGLDSLYLLHLSVEKKVDAGETLLQIIDIIRSHIHSDSLAFASFEDRLLGAGYLAAHSMRYRNIGYILHDVHLYKVDEQFPRITPRTLLPGVGNVQYSISAVACQPFSAELDTFSAQLGAL